MELVWLLLKTARGLGEYGQTLPGDFYWIPLRGTGRPANKTLHTLLEGTSMGEEQRDGEENIQQTVNNK